MRTPLEVRLVCTETNPSERNGQRLWRALRRIQARFYGTRVTAGADQELITLQTQIVEHAKHLGWIDQSAKLFFKWD